MPRARRGERFLGVLDLSPGARECGFGDRQFMLGLPDHRFHRTAMLGSLSRPRRLLALSFRLGLSIDATDLPRGSRRRWSNFNRTRVAMIATRCVTARGLTSRGWIHRDAGER